MKLVWRQRTPCWLSETVLSCKAQPSQAYAARQVIPPLITHIPADPVIKLRPKHQLMTCMFSLTAIVPFKVNGQTGNSCGSCQAEANRHRHRISAVDLAWMCARCRNKQPMSSNSWNCPAQVRNEMELFEKHYRSSRSIPRM